MCNKKIVAIVLAAGTGKRMENSTPKQYLELEGKPILYYSLKAFEESNVDYIILVVGKNDIEYCRANIVNKYNFTKIKSIVEGGKERYHSVYNGLSVIDDADYVLIHDGARPFVSLDIIERTIKAVTINEACVVGVPSKDTIKIVNKEGFVEETPNREKLWSVQTPQAFSYSLIKRAYDTLWNLQHKNLVITDDAMVVEHTLNHRVKLVMGEYTNIKITTPEDLIIGKSIIVKDGS